MKYILTFLLIAFLNVFVSAQKENTAFLEKKMITWLDTEISTFEEAIKSAEVAHDNKDFTGIGKSKSNILRGLRRFSTNCDLLYNQIAADRVNLAEANQNGDIVMGHFRYIRKKSQDRLQELYVDEKGEKQLQKDVLAIESKYEEIQKNNLDFFPSQKHTTANLADAKEILAAAQDISAILHQGIISE
ncbi:hypothetical protein N9L92_04625 [Saprospiraceae bacterium]|nr:hypothetical protein [Saprospiraceae bacterium]